jgi:hypothetical protein
MIKSAVLLCTALTQASDVSSEAGFDEPEKSLCLLNVAQKRHQRSFGDSNVYNLEVSNNEFNLEEGISLNISQHTTWLLQYSQSERAMNSSLDDLEGDDLEGVAEYQETLAQHCRERLEATKGQLKRLASDTSDFSAKVKDHERKLIEYKQKLNSSENSITEFETRYRKALDSCEQQRSRAKKDQEHYAKVQGELKRLIAGVANGEGMAILLQMAAAMALHQAKNSWNIETCRSFLAFLKRNRELSPRESVPSDEDCATKLESTKKVFTLTTSRISDLEKTAGARVEDRTCENNARLMQSTSLAPMVAERTTITSGIVESTNSLALMRPVFERLRTHVSTFDNHVKKIIGPECDKAGKVVKSLRTLKDLLASLAKCPGKDGGAVLLAV